VARCIESGWWFCNSNGGTSASHLIQHMVRARHKEVCLHPDSPLGETIVECYNCSSRNLFMMGFLPKGDGVVVLLCRNCLGIGALKEEWDAESWTPLVRDRALVPWLVKVPDAEVEVRARHLSAAQIDRLEALWKTNPTATLEDLERPGVEDEPAPVLLRYEDGFHFQNIFGPLVQIEADYDRDMKEALTEDNVSVRWHEVAASSAEHSKWLAADVFFSPGASESMRLTIGDELLLRLSRRLLPPSRNAKSDWETKATVVSVGDPGEPTSVELRANSRPPLDQTEGFSVSFVWKPITFDRMQFAMKRFAVAPNAISNFLYHKILGHDVVDEFQLHGASAANPENLKTMTAPGLPALNPSQQSAVQQVLPRQLALIQGPPGTGKTVTMATLVYHMVRVGRLKNAQFRGAVLVCAPSNVAVDHVAEKIAMTGCKVVRLSAKSREHIASQIEHLTLHAMVAQIEQGGAAKPLGKDAAAASAAQKTRPKRSKSGDGSKRRRQLERELLRTADVVCCTCAGAGGFSPSAGLLRLPAHAGQRYRQATRGWKAWCSAAC
jgi:regulator of nonsense transcripts 1